MISSTTERQHAKGICIHLKDFQFEGCQIFQFTNKIILHCLHGQEGAETQAWETNLAAWPLSRSLAEACETQSSRSKNKNLPRQKAKLRSHPCWHHLANFCQSHNWSYTFSWWLGLNSAKEYLVLLHTAKTGQLQMAASSPPPSSLIQSITAQH